MRTADSGEDERVGGRERILDFVKWKVHQKIKRFNFKHRFSLKN
jgi:hypothetical protein